jgi:hypothetical protein
MATRFTPCPACKRHVRDGDVACPFCGAPPSPAPSLSRSPSARLSRAAFLALGAAGALGGTACSSTSEPPAPVEAGPRETDANEPDASIAQPIYGAMVPPLDAGEPGDGEPQREGGFAEPLYGAIAPPYGLPPVDQK